MQNDALWDAWIQTQPDDLIELGPHAVAFADWQEDLHPRAEDGKFTTGTGTTGVASSRGKEFAKAEFHRLKGEWARVNNLLLDHLEQPNAPQAKALADRLKTIVKEMYKLDADPGGAEGIGLPGGARDMVVVGAGPGGLAAAVMGATDGLDTLVVDANPKPGGQAKFSSRVENYPGFPIGASGRQLAGNMFDQVERLGAEAKLGVRVMDVSYDPLTGLKTVSLSTGEKLTARTVIVAGGVEFTKLQLPGGESHGVIYADGEELMKQGAGKPVVVLGGSNGAAQAALGAARTAESVYLISRSPITKGMSDYQVSALRNHPKIQVIENEELSSMAADEFGHVKSVDLKSGRTVKAHAVGVFIGGAPNLSWLPKDIERHAGKVKVNENLETTMPGVYAVGDTRHGSIGRIGAAVGDGQLAARNVWSYFGTIPKAAAGAH